MNCTCQHLFNECFTNYAHSYQASIFVHANRMDIYLALIILKTVLVHKQRKL